MKLHQYYVYILANNRNTVIYTGVTGDLVRRVHEHKNGLIAWFTKRYNVHNLVYYEIFDRIEMAISREKQIKGITRKKKNDLINSFNPDWKELYKDGVITKP